MEVRKVDKLFVAMKSFVVYNGKVLLLQESTKYDDGTQAGRWGVPGGRINPGEDFRDALLREIKEETGLDVKLGRPFTVQQWWPQPKGEKWQVVATFWESIADTDKVILSKDHSAFEWIKPEDYKNYDCPSGEPEAFEEYLKLKHSSVV